MFPKHHIILGAIFAILILIVFPSTPIYGAILIFFSSFLIDFDHYIAYVFLKKDFSLKNSVYFYTVTQSRIAKEERKRGIKRPGPFQIFHTLEFHLFVLILGLLVWKPFIYIFIGMAFHTFLDIIYMAKLGYLYRRDFFLTHKILFQ